MKTLMELHRTNESVPETGKYICAAGETRDIQQGQAFPKCPIHNEPTTWRHIDHRHKTGEKVTVTGDYIDSDGEQIHLNAGNSFPNCPESDQPTTWKHADI